MDINNYSYTNNDSISRIIDGLDNDELSITLAEEHDYFGEYYFSVSGYSYKSGCIFELFIISISILKADLKPIQKPYGFTIRL